MTAVDIEDHLVRDYLSMQNMAIACLPSGATGNTSAAIATSHIRSTFPSIIFDPAVGVGGEAPSVKNDTRLGDMVISKSAETSDRVIRKPFRKDIPCGQTPCIDCLICCSTL